MLAEALKKFIGSQNWKVHAQNRLQGKFTLALSAITKDLVSFHHSLPILEPITCGKRDKIVLSGFGQLDPTCRGQCLPEHTIAEQLGGKEPAKDHVDGFTKGEWKLREPAMERGLQLSILPGWGVPVRMLIRSPAAWCWEGGNAETVNCAVSGREEV